MRNEPAARFVGVDPRGRRTTERAWAAELGLFYTPTLILFEPGGREVMRIDSVVQFYRLWGVLDYVNRRGYDSGVDYQRWRLQQRETS